MVICIAINGIVHVGILTDMSPTLDIAAFCLSWWLAAIFTPAATSSCQKLQQLPQLQLCRLHYTIFLSCSNSCCIVMLYSLMVSGISAMQMGYFPINVDVMHVNMNIPLSCLTAKANRARAQSDPTRLCHSLDWLVLLQHIVCCQLIEKSKTCALCACTVATFHICSKTASIDIPQKMVHTCCD